METTVPQLVLKYVPLGTLREQDKKEQISAEENLETLCQSLSALRHLHKHESPIVHQDIKPNNILAVAESFSHQALQL